ncbi:MAG: caspase family protein [Actinomycetota bacterium]
MTRQVNPVAGLSRQQSTFKFKTLSLAVAACLGTIAPAVLANPTGATVASGSATFATQGGTLTVTNSNGAIINWQQFNIGANETTRFIQPNAQSTVLNRVVGVDPSQIMGTLQSNGQVFLINPNGIVFGRSAIIDVPGLIASTLNLSDADFQSRKFNFSGGGFGPLVNQGRISTPLGGSVMLIGSDVRNEGVITTPQGQVVLAAGKSVSLVDTAGPELSVTLTASGNKAVNLGEINATGGKIDIFGALIEQQGILRADSASVDAQGRIILKATESTTVSGSISATNSAGQGGSIQVLGKDVTLTGTASIDASGAAGGGQVLVGGDWQGKNPSVANAQTTTMQAGASIKADATGNGNGGKVVLWSEQNTDFKGSIFARGGASGGNGGQVETSGHSLQIGGTVDTRAPKGAMGFWLLDPAAYCFDNTSSACSINHPTATFVSTAAVAQALQTSLVAYQATDYIVINGLSLNDPTYNGGYTTMTGATLGFQAPYIAQYGMIHAGNPLNVKMQATGVSASFPALSGVIESYGDVITKGGELYMDASQCIVLDSGTFNVNGTAGGYNYFAGDTLWDMYLRAPAIVLAGKTVYADDLNFETNALQVGGGALTTPLLGTVNWAAVTTHSSGKAINVGMSASNPACTSSLCIDSQLGSPSLSISKGVTFAAGRCLGGPNNCDLSTVQLDGDVTVHGPFAVSTTGDLDFIGKNVILNYGLVAPSSMSHITLFAANTFTNNVGPTAIDTSSGGTWSVVMGDEAGSNLNGLTAPKFTVDLDGVTAYEHDNTWPIGNAIYVLSAALANSLTDPCLVNPTLCAVNNPTTATSDQSKVTTTTTTATTTGVSTPTAALTVDSQLTVSSSSTTSTGAVATTSAVSRTSSTQEAKLEVSKRDNDKSVGEVKAEAKKAREDAGKAEAEAKKAEAEATKAETEAKKAEAEAKAAKTPAEKAAAKQRAEAKKAEAEERKAEAEAKKAEAEVKKAEAEGREALAEAKSAPKTGAAAKQTQAETKQAQAEAKKAEAEAKKSAAEGKQAEVRAKEAQAEAKQAEAEAKSAKTPEQKQAAAQKAEVKKAEADAHKTEGEARKVEAEGKKIEAEAKKAEAEVKKAEAEARQAKAPEQKAAAEKRAEAKRADAEVKKTEAEAKKTEAEAKQAQADAKMAEAEAKGARSAGGRAVVEKEVEAKRAEGEHKQAEAAVKKAEAEVKKAEAVIKKAEAEGKKTDAVVKKAEAEMKKAQAEVEAKKAEAEKKRVEAEKKVEAHRVAQEKRQVERRAEAAKAFASVVTAGANRAALENLAALRHELKTETFRPALNVLKVNPAAADLPPCGAGSTVCIPTTVAPQAAALSLPMPPAPKFAALPQIQRKVAVVIGVNKYADPSIPSLESALPDAQAVGQQLQEQLGYEVRVVPDATRADIVTNLNKLSQEVGPNDSVTVYYAGHGYLSDKTKTGYWIPADAKVTSPDNWISNSDIGKLLSNIPAKQVMLVSDSCYSGSLTKEQKITGAAGSLDPSGILSKRSVTVMSSGGEEPVSDEGKEGHSIFAYSFMSALKSVKQVDAGAKLFENVRNEVSKDYPQTPQYGGAVSAGHAPGGDYLFETRSYK